MRQELKRITLLLVIAATPALCEPEADKSKSPETVLYIWAGDQARIAPDFLAVVDFDAGSDNYGHVIKTVPIPPPGNVGNEPHHCHLNKNKTILGCGGLLSVFLVDESRGILHHRRFLSYSGGRIPDQPDGRRRWHFTGTNRRIRPEPALRRESLRQHFHVFGMAEDSACGRF